MNSTVSISTVFADDGAFFSLIWDAITWMFFCLMGFPWSPVDTMCSLVSWCRMRAERWKFVDPSLANTDDAFLFLHTLHFIAPDSVLSSHGNSFVHFCWNTLSFPGSDTDSLLLWLQPPNDNFVCLGSGFSSFVLRGIFSSRRRPQGTG